MQNADGQLDLKPALKFGTVITGYALENDPLVLLLCRGNLP